MDCFLAVFHEVCFDSVLKHMIYSKVVISSCVMSHDLFPRFVGGRRGCLILFILSSLLAKLMSSVYLMNTIRLNFVSTLLISYLLFCLLISVGIAFVIVVFLLSDSLFLVL